MLKASYKTFLRQVSVVPIRNLDQPASQPKVLFVRFVSILKLMHKQSNDPLCQSSKNKISIIC